VLVEQQVTYNSPGAGEEYVLVYQCLTHNIFQWRWQVAISLSFCCCLCLPQLFVIVFLFIILVIDSKGDTWCSTSLSSLWGSLITEAVKHWHMACLVKESHNFTCHPCIHLLMEWTMPLPSQIELMLTYQPQRHGGLSWPDNIISNKRNISHLLSL